MAALLWGCHGGGPSDAAEAKAQAEASARQLITTSALWYDGLGSAPDADTIGLEIQSLAGEIGAIDGYRVLLDRGGAPVDVSWEQSFWDRASGVMDDETLREWKSYSVDVLNAVRFASGIASPETWSSPNVVPIVETVATDSGMTNAAIRASLERLIPLPHEGPTTVSLKSLMPTFPARCTFPRLPL